MTEAERDIIDQLNAGRFSDVQAAVDVTYFVEVDPGRKPNEGIREAVKQILENGTAKLWEHEAPAGTPKPKSYDAHLSWVQNMRILETQGVEAALICIAYPLAFFDRGGVDGAVPLAQLLTAVAGEPMAALLIFRSARVVDIRFPEALRSRFPGVRWSHRRLRSYLQLDDNDPILGTIVKPKTGLTAQLFSRAVAEAASAGARFTKADENLHLDAKQLRQYVNQTVRELEVAGFDLTQGTSKKMRFLFAPHITIAPTQIMEYAHIAVEEGANALMFSPYYSGGFESMAEVANTYDVPIYAHTAGMTQLTGYPRWGFDPRIMYVLAGLFSAAFMQLTATGSYLRPTDEEKPLILQRLIEEKLRGSDGMTLVIAGGVGPRNIGINLETFGTEGVMFLGGSSVYGHPDGAFAGVRAMDLAFRAYRDYKFTGIEELKSYANSLGEEGKPLARAFEPTAER